MHPVFTHVPPNLWRSIIATVLPAPANRAAMDGPAWPVPIMIASKCFMGRSVCPLYVELAVFGCLFGRLPVLTRDNVGGIPTRPVVLRSGRFVLAVVLLSLLQELGQRRDIQFTKSSARQPRCDFLKQPSIAVGITKRGERAVGSMLGCWPADATAAVDLELSARRSGVEHLTHLNTACDKIFPCCLDIGDDQVEAFGRAWRSGCHLHAKLNRAPGTGRRELDNPETVIEREVGVEPPPQFGVELLRAVNIRDRNYNHLELHIYSLGTSAADRFTARR